MNKIPLQPQAERFRLTIDDRTVALSTYYIYTTDSWKLTIKENDQTLVAGVGLLNGIDILRPYNLNLGSLGLINITDSHEDANSLTLGSQVLLVHMTEEEYEEYFGS